jgi:hypothetical protein
MAKAAADFRTLPFDANKVDASGKNVGGKVYWKLYAIENLIRIVVHSVLTAQLGPNWWTIAADPKTQQDIADLKRSYGKKPWYSTPGKHEVYYLLLSQLTKILTTNSNQFKPHIPDIDQWTARLEQIRLPRNIVGHMNWLSDIDRGRIDVCHADVQQLVTHLAKNPQLTLTIP